MFSTAAVEGGGRPLPSLYPWSTREEAEAVEPGSDRNVVFHKKGKGSLLLSLLQCSFPLWPPPPPDYKPR